MWRLPPPAPLQIPKNVHPESQLGTGESRWSPPGEQGDDWYWSAPACLHITDHTDKTACADHVCLNHCELSGATEGMQGGVVERRLQNVCSNATRTRPTTKICSRRHHSAGGSSLAVVTHAHTHRHKHTHTWLEKFASVCMCYDPSHWARTSRAFQERKHLELQLLELQQVYSKSPDGAAGFEKFCGFVLEAI